jgi:pimeloyl-ACP methyl ester carboxylesterase
VLNRRNFLCGAAALLALPTLNAMGQASADIPIVFVHGNGDQAPIWLTTTWRFESNGCRRERLNAINFFNPTARDDNGISQPNRSSVEDQLNELTQAIDRIRTATGAPQLALVGLSRGGNAIRHLALILLVLPPACHVYVACRPKSRCAASSICSS